VQWIAYPLLLGHSCTNHLIGNRVICGPRVNRTRHQTHAPDP
jgi:hypothetical protein